MKTTAVSMGRIWLNDYCIFFCLESVMNLEIPSHVSLAFSSCTLLPFRCDSSPILSLISIADMSYILLNSPGQSTEFSPLCPKINETSSVTSQMPSQAEYPELNTIYPCVQNLSFLFCSDLWIHWKLSSLPTFSTVLSIHITQNTLINSYSKSIIFQDPVNISFMFTTPNAFKTGVEKLWEEDCEFRSNLSYLERTCL